MIGVIYDDGDFVMGSVKLDTDKEAEDFAFQLPYGWTLELRSGEGKRDRASRTQQAPTNGDKHSPYSSPSPYHEKGASHA